MIVEPDFPDHWKSRLLVELSGDESAPLWVLRLWAHCQRRRTQVFNPLSAAAVKVICRAPFDAEQVDAWLTEAGFLRRSDMEVTVHQWEEYNASLVASWQNGKRGGRPRKSPAARAQDATPPPPQNPDQTHEKPPGYPRATHGEPSPLLLSTPQIREEKRKARGSREEVIAYCLQLGLPASDGEWFSDRCDGCGWKNGGKPIVDWQATVRAWKQAGHMASQKSTGRNGNSAGGYAPRPKAPSCI